MTPDELAQVPLEERAGSQTHWHPCNHHSCQGLARRQLNMLRRDITPWHKALEQENDSLGRTLEQAAAKNDELVRSLTELKELVLLGPLTAEEWMEFRLLPDADEERELLRCCANTSAIRDEVFYLMRNYSEDPLLGRAPMQRIVRGINGHRDLIEGDHPAAVRLHHLLTRMADYYGVPMDYERYEEDR